jgi:hypothetical protein
LVNLHESLDGIERKVKSHLPRLRINATGDRFECDNLNSNNSWHALFKHILAMLDIVKVMKTVGRRKIHLGQFLRYLSTLSDIVLNDPQGFEDYEELRDVDWSAEYSRVWSWTWGWKRWDRTLCLANWGKKGDWGFVTMPDAAVCADRLTPFPNADGPCDEAFLAHLIALQKKGCDLVSRVPEITIPETVESDIKKDVSRDKFDFTFNGQPFCPDEHLPLLIAFAKTLKPLQLVALLFGIVQPKAGSLAAMGGHSDEDEFLPKRPVVDQLGKFVLGPNGEMMFHMFFPFGKMTRKVCIESVNGTIMRVYSVMEIWTGYELPGYDGTRIECVTSRFTMTVYVCSLSGASTFKVERKEVPNPVSVVIPAEVVAPNQGKGKEEEGEEDNGDDAFDHGKIADIIGNDYSNHAGPAGLAGLDDVPAAAVVSAPATAVTDAVVLAQAQAAAMLTQARAATTLAQAQAQAAASAQAQAAATLAQAQAQAAATLAQAQAAATLAQAAADAFKEAIPDDPLHDSAAAAASAAIEAAAAVVLERNNRQDMVTVACASTSAPSKRRRKRRQDMVTAAGASTK